MRQFLVGTLLVSASVLLNADESASEGIATPKASEGRFFVRVTGDEFEHLLLGPRV